MESSAHKQVCDSLANVQQKIGTSPTLTNLSLSDTVRSDLELPQRPQTHPLENPTELVYSSHTFIFIHNLCQKEPINRVNKSA
jgi:hypothetical protein